MNQKKLCIYCKYCEITRAASAFYSDTNSYTCIHPKLGFDLVTGKQILRCCSIVRKSDDKCGPNGAWFEYKTTELDTKLHSSDVFVCIFDWFNGLYNKILRRKANNE